MKNTKIKQSILTATSTKESLHTVIIKSRIFVIITIIALNICTLHSKTSLTRPLQSFRSGDKLFKEQISYKDPGRRGMNVVWDFSHLTIINSEYVVRFIEPIKKNKDSLFLNCIEHSTIYSYALKDDSLFMTGFENSGSRLALGNSQLCLRFPFTYGDSITDNYYGSGTYLNTVLTQTEGVLTTVADAMGTLILPDGDTLYNALRVHSEQCYTQRTLPIVYEVDMRHSDTDSLYTDSINFEEGQIKKDPENKKNKDASEGKIHGQKKGIRGKLLMKTDSLLFRTETYRWYAPGYRYPIFETICNKGHRTISDTIQMQGISTAFYFPPSKHTYLENDPDNRSILDSLLAVHHTQTTLPTDSLPFDYNFYPNPVRELLNVELLLEQSSEVTFRIYNSSGSLVLVVKEGKRPAGINYFTLNTSRLLLGEHILNIVVNKRTARVLLLKI